MTKIKAISIIQDEIGRSYLSVKNVLDYKGVVRARYHQLTGKVLPNDIKLFTKECIRLGLFRKPRVQTHKIFVYGTLKKGYWNNHYLGKDAKFIRKADLNDFTLLQYGSIPYAIRSPGNHIKGELWSISGKALKQVRMLEQGYKEGRTGEGAIFYYVENIKLKNVKRIGSEYNHKG